MNVIIIMTTHDEQEIMECDRCLVMKEGKITELPKKERTIEKVKAYICK